MAFLQDYTMLDELGRGGFAVVYKVRHNELEYIRAVRVLNETIVDANSKTYQKFLRECKLLLRLGNGNHPNIVHIYQPRLLDNKALVEMDYVDGMDIAHYLKQNQNFVPIEEVTRMAEQVSSALAYCHEEIYRFCMDRNEDNLQDDPDDGSKVLIDEQTRKRLIEKYKVIHNDIHSGNIMRRENGNFILLDFGLAISGNEVVRSSRHTNGAPEFKAPEKWEDETTLTEQSDIYSFGIVLYQYLAGRVPFPFNTSMSNKTKAEYLLSKAHQSENPPFIEPLRKEFFEKKYEGQEYKRDYPIWLEEALMKCLNKDPKDRFNNGRELHEFIVNHMKEDKAPQNVHTVDKETMAQFESMRERVEMLSEQVNEKQEKLLQREQELHKAKENIILLEEEKKYLENKLNEKQKPISGTDGKFEQLEEEKKKLEITLNELQDSNKFLNAQLNEKQNLLKKANELVKLQEEKLKASGVSVPSYTARFCRKCGTILRDNAKFCKKCGTKVK